MKDGRPVRVETYAPADSDHHPAVILLHGADNFEPHAVAYRTSAEQLAEHGYVTLLVHYFDATGTRNADPDTIARNFLDWLETAAAAVSFAAGKENVEPDHIGFAGFSLGASLALSLATQDIRVAAVAEFYGSLPDLAAAFLKRMPPVLILHGTEDQLIPSSEAYKLQRLWESKGIPYEMKIYPGQGHGFTGAAVADAEARTLAFFDRYLKRETKASAAPLLPSGVSGSGLSQNRAR
jgi:carboxymethylenebutenolidase